MYYPKSQLQTDLYTNGGEFKLSNGGTEYVGNYFIAQGNKIFSGKNPNNKPNYPLEPYSVNLTYSSTSPPDSEVLPTTYFVIDDSYYWATDKNPNEIGIPPSAPTQISPQPTKSDYNVGEFDRYFLKKINEIQYVEISLTEYTKYISEEPNVNWRLYKAYKLPWEITGDRNSVFNVNKNTVNRVQSNLNLPGFKSYFKEKYDQFYLYTPQENLYTKGNEFKLVSDGRLYKGYYHIHPQKGPMVGRTHSKIEHSYLLPISGYNSLSKTLQQENPSKNYRKSSGY